jgi:hypothetical protein
MVQQGWFRLYLVTLFVLMISTCFVVPARRLLFNKAGLGFSHIG